MKRKLTAKVFKQWLQENGVYDQYTKNLGLGGFDSVEEVVKILWDLPAFIISGAFDWNKAEEGTYFWFDINNKWLDYLPKILTNKGKETKL